MSDSQVSAKASSHTHPPAMNGPLLWTPAERAHLVFDIVLILVLGGYLATATQLPYMTESTPGPGFFPVWAGSIALALLALDAVLLVVKRQRHGWARPEGRPYAKIFLVLAVPALYLALVGILGHTITIALVTLALLLTFGRPVWWKALIIVIATAVGSDLLFVEVLGVRLPDGLIEADVSSWI